MTNQSLNLSAWLTVPVVISFVEVAKTSFHQNGDAKEVPSPPVGVDRPRGCIDGMHFLRASAAVAGNRPVSERLVEGSVVSRQA
jgi:hypothetical protein